MHFLDIVMIVCIESCEDMSNCQQSELLEKGNE